MPPRRPITTEQVRAAMYVLGCVVDFDNLQSVDGWPALKAKAIERYRKLALDAHPDRGGSDERMAELNAAYDLVRSLRMTHFERRRPVRRPPLFTSPFAPGQPGFGAGHIMEDLLKQVLDDVFKRGFKTRRTVVVDTPAEKAAREAAEQTAADARRDAERAVNDAVGDVGFTSPKDGKRGVRAAVLRRCTSCGAYNDPVQVRCYHCGGLLEVQSDVQCAYCFAFNPVNRETCRQCARKLKTAVVDSGPSIRQPWRRCPQCQMNNGWNISRCIRCGGELTP